LIACFIYTLFIQCRLDVPLHPEFFFFTAGGRIEILEKKIEPALNTH